MAIKRRAEPSTECAATNSIGWEKKIRSSSKYANTIFRERERGCACTQPRRKLAEVNSIVGLVIAWIMCCSGYECLRTTADHNAFKRCVCVCVCVYCAMQLNTLVVAAHGHNSVHFKISLTVFSFCTKLAIAPNWMCIQMMEKRVHEKDRGRKERNKNHSVHVVVSCQPTFHICVGD